MGGAFELQGVRVPRDKICNPPDITVVWGILGGLATGAGMASACTQVSDGCEGMFIAMLLPWLGWGALGGATLALSSTTTIPHFQPDLAPYARFPQGLPPGATEADLRPRSGGR